MKIEIENTLIHIFVIGGSVALIGAVLYLFMMLSDYLKEFLLVATIG